MLVLPISMASNIDSLFTLQHRDIARNDPMAGSVGALDNQRSVAVDSFSLSNQNLVFQFYFYLLFALTEIGFPTRRDGAKPRLLENSIATVEVLNQSPKKTLATDGFLPDLHKRSRALANNIRHQVPGIIYIDSDAKDNKLNAFGRAG